MVSTAKQGEFSLIRMTQDGRIQQMALSVQSHLLLQQFLQSISTPDNPIVEMSKEYDLVPCNPKDKP